MVAFNGGFDLAIGSFVESFEGYIYAFEFFNIIKARAKEATNFRVREVMMTRKISQKIGYLNKRHSIKINSVDQLC